jgi:hypothetical protein
MMVRTLLFETLVDWIRERPINPPGMYKLFSFLLFFFLSVLAAVTFPAIIVWFFVLLLIVDALGTLLVTDLIVSIDRAIFFLLLVVYAIVENPTNVFFLTVEILALFAALDFSFLLRKLDGTGVDSGIFIKRLGSYSRTILPAFLLTYLFLFVYSYNIQMTEYESLIVFGLAAAGALFAIYTVARYLFSLDNKRKVIIQE